MTEVNLSLMVTEPDPDEARRFLDLLDLGGSFTFQTFADKKDDQKDWQVRGVFHGSLDDHATTLATLNPQGAGVFVMVNEGDGEVHVGERTCRTAKNVIRVRALFVDLDGSPIEPVQDAQPHPNIIVNSSPGRYHAYWLVSDVDLAEFTMLQKRLIARFNGDKSVHDLCRVMRLPGFLHQKHEPFVSRIIYPGRESNEQQ